MHQKLFAVDLVYHIVFCGIYEMQITFSVCELIQQFLKTVKFSSLYPKYEHVMLGLHIVYCSVPFDHDYFFSHGLD